MPKHIDWRLTIIYSDIVEATNLSPSFAIKSGTIGSPGKGAFIDTDQVSYHGLCFVDWSNTEAHSLKKVISTFWSMLRLPTRQLYNKRISASSASKTFPSKNFTMCSEIPLFPGFSRAASSLPSLVWRLWIANGKKRSKHKPKLRWPVQRLRLMPREQHMLHARACRSTLKSLLVWIGRAVANWKKVISVFKLTCITAFLTKYFQEGTLWDIETITKTAAKFPDMVYKCPQLTT